MRQASDGFDLFSPYMPFSLGGFMFNIHMTLDLRLQIFYLLTYILPCFPPLSVLTCRSIQVPPYTAGPLYPKQYRFSYVIHHFSSICLSQVFEMGFLRGLHAYVKLKMDDLRVWLSESILLS